MPFFKNVFRSKDGPRSASKAGHHDAPVAPPKPRWEESWSRKDVAPEEIQELIHVCTQEMKSRGTSSTHWRVWARNANTQQLWTCPLCCSPSAPLPIPAHPAISCATFSRQITKVLGSTEENRSLQNCASLSHWYAIYRPAPRVQRR